MDPWIAPAAAAAAVALAAAVPSPVRAGVRVALLLALLLAPVIGVGVLVAHWPGASFGTWLGLVPLAVVWLAWFDMRWGVSARFAVRRVRSQTPFAQFRDNPPDADAGQRTRGELSPNCEKGV